jgi:adenylosuccinate lyase
MPSPLAALSPLDGRYARTADPLRAYFSEQALIRYRVRIELAWLQALAAERGIREVKPFSRKTLAAFAALVAGFHGAAIVGVALALASSLIAFVTLGASRNRRRRSAS